VDWWSAMPGPDESPSDSDGVGVSYSRCVSLGL